MFGASEFQYCVLDPLRIGNKTMVQVRWDKPQSGWTHLNIDGLAFGNPVKAGGGGLIRDDQGNWVAGFSRNIGFSTSFMAKL